MAPAAYGKKMVAVAPPQRLPEPAPVENAAPPAAEELPDAAADQATPPAAANDAPPTADEPSPDTATQPVTPAAEAAAESTPAPAAAASKPAPAASNEPSADQDASLDSLLADDKKAAPEEMPLDQAEPVAPGKAIDTGPSATGVAADNIPSAADAGDAPSLPGTSGVAATEEVGPTTAREVSPAELSQDLAKVSAANERMTAALATDDKNELKKVRANFYISFYGLADDLALAKQDPLAGDLDPARRDAERLAMTLAGDPGRLNELKSYGAKWLAFGKRTTPGIVLAGKVQSAEQVGKLHQIKLQVTPDTPQVTVLSQADPGVESGDQVLALGSIVENPSIELAGYDGADAQIVWSGLTLKLPAR
jgi:hypothetical protein